MKVTIDITAAEAAALDDVYRDPNVWITSIPAKVQIALLEARHSSSPRVPPPPGAATGEEASAIRPLAPPPRLCRRLRARAAAVTGPTDPASDTGSTATGGDAPFPGAPLPISPAIAAALDHRPGRGGDQPGPDAVPPLRSRGRVPGRDTIGTRIVAPAVTVAAGLALVAVTLGVAPW